MTSLKELHFLKSLRLERANSAWDDISTPNKSTIFREVLSKFAILPFLQLKVISSLPCF